MISNFFSEKRIQETNFLFRLDPRVKIISFSALIVAVVFTPSPHFYKFLVYFLILSVVTVFSRIPLKNFIGKLILIFPFLAFLAVTLLIFGGNELSKDLNILWNLTIKSVLSFLCLSLLVFTTNFFHLIKGLELLKMPKVITSVLSFAYRYSLLFAQEAERLKRAKESRSFRNRKILEEVKILFHIVPHFFLKTLERSERIYAAMLSRGFERKIKTLSYFRIRKIEVVYNFLFILFLFFVVTYQ